MENILNIDINIDIIDLINIDIGSKTAKYDRNHTGLIAKAPNQVFELLKVEKVPNEIPKLLNFFPKVLSRVFSGGRGSKIHPLPSLFNRLRGDNVW